MAAKNPRPEPAVGKTIAEWDEWVADHPPLNIPLPDGETIELPPPEMWSWEVMEFVEAHPDEPIGLLKLLLDHKDIARLRASKASPGYVFAQLQAAAGIDVGKLSASSGS